MSGLASVSALSSSDVPVTRHFSPLERKNQPFKRLRWSLQPVPKHPDFPASRPAVEPDYPRNESRFDQKVSFCDWVSIYQAHTESGVELPKLNDGCFVRYDVHGAHESTTLKKLKVEGSHESAIFIRSDGVTVWFEGNVSKFGRQDNVFGFSFIDCLARINAILASLGLPPFGPSSFRVELDVKSTM